MTDPGMSAIIDQAAAAVRDGLDAVGISVSDREQLRVVRATAYVIARLRERAVRDGLAPEDVFETFVLGLNEIGDTQ